MTFEDQWLSMAVGALRAAGLAAAALGYHVWRLLTKQGSDPDIEDYDEVLTYASLLLSGFATSLLLHYPCRREATLLMVCRVCGATLWGLRSSCPLSVETVHKLLAQVPEALKCPPR